VTACQTTFTLTIGLSAATVTMMISAEWLAARLEQLPTRKEMYRAVLLGMTAGAGLVKYLAGIFR
jgi:hypothetical protein